MQPIRQILTDAPELIPVPLELQHQPLEIIFWPLSKTYDKNQVGTDSINVIDEIRQLVQDSKPVELSEFQLDLNGYTFDREEANAR